MPELPRMAHHRAAAAAGGGQVMSPDLADLLGPDDVQTAARELAERTAASQGLPARVTDHVLLERVACLARSRDT